MIIVRSLLSPSPIWAPSLSEDMLTSACLLLQVMFDGWSQARTLLSAVCTSPATRALELMCLLCGCFGRRLQRHMCLYYKSQTLTDGAPDARQARTQGIFVAELQAAYAALRAGRALALPPLPVQYYDYTAWQRRRLGSGELGGSIEYWRRSLDGVPVLELPTDRPHPPGGISAAGGFVEVRVPVGTAAALRRLTAQCGTTLFTTMLSAWKVRCVPVWLGYQPSYCRSDVVSC